MNASSPLRKARTVLLFSVVLVVIGLVPVLYFVGLLVWQISVLFQAGSWTPLPATLLFTDQSVLQAGRAAPVFAWILGKLHVGLVPAVVGSLIAALGALSAWRQKSVIREHKQQHEDRLRRTRDYRRDAGQTDAFDSRREPYIGSGSIARNADRHAA